MIEKITRNFVPIAANLYKIRDSKDAAGELFRSAQKQKDQYQGFWIMTPDGKVLSAHHEHSDYRWTEEVLAAIDDGIDKAGPIKPRNPQPKDVLPEWGKGVQKDGKVTLAIWTRYFVQGKGLNTGAIDAVTWSAKEWQAFAPPEPSAGKTWRIPADMGAEFSRCLSTVSDKSMMPSPDDVTKVDLNGSVSRVSDGMATLSFTGHIAALHTHTFNKKYVYRSKATLTGVGTYDIAKKEMVSLLWIFEGSSRLIGETTPHPLAAVVEWRRGADAGKSEMR